MSSENNYTIKCSSWFELPNSINELSEIITNNVIPAQNDSNKEWEIIRVEIWEDTGRYIAFPAMREFINRTDVSVAQIICTEIQKEIEEVDYSELPEDIQDKKTEEIVIKMANFLENNLPKNITYTYEIYNQDGYKIAI